MAVQEIYLVRHGQTDFNLQGIIQGRGVNSSLNETGRAQARMFFEYHKNLKFDFILTSQLNRTQETMAPFVEAGYLINPLVQLDEIDWGHHEGKAGNEQLHAEYKEVTGSWRNGDLQVSTPGGESPLKLQERQLDFIENLLPQYPGRLLICSHGRAMRSLLCTMLGRPLSEMDEFPHTNLSLYKLLYDGKAFEIQLFNFTDHLKNT